MDNIIYVYMSGFADTTRVSKTSFCLLKSWLWIAATASQTDLIMQLIRACNPNLPTVELKLFKALF